MSVTLNQNEFVANLVNLIVVTRLNNTSNGKRINDLLDFVVTDQVEYGDGLGIISVDTLDVEDYSANTSLLTPRKPTMDEAVLSTTDKKLVAVTINRYLMKGAFANEYSLEEAIAVITSMLEKTKNIYMYKKTVSAYEGWAPVDNSNQPVNVDTQIVTVKLIDTTGMDGMRKTESEKANAIEIFTQIREKSLSVQAPSRKYNELEFEEMYNADELGLIINSKFDTLMNNYAMATLPQSMKLEDIRIYDKSILIPSEQLQVANRSTVIGWLASKLKYRIAPRFVVATNFFDGSNLNLTEFLHFWLNSGFAKGLACIKFVAEYVAPANRYGITYMDGSTEIDGLEPTYYFVGAGANLPVAEKEGYTFDGWYDNSSLTGDPITAISPSSVGDITLYAKFTAE